jgi:hypothetical protein
MRAQNNAENPPEHIVAACRRMLSWVRDKKLRAVIKQRIERLERDR